MCWLKYKLQYTIYYSLQTVHSRHVTVSLFGGYLLKKLRSNVIAALSIFVNFRKFLEHSAVTSWSIDSVLNSILQVCDCRGVHPPKPMAQLFICIHSIPSPRSRGSGGPPPENVEILHCYKWILAHFRSKKYGFWLKVLARENIEYSCDCHLEEISGWVKPLEGKEIVELGVSHNRARSPAPSPLTTIIEVSKQQ